MAGSAADHRKLKRYALTLPVQVRVKAEAPVPASTKDISGSGLYFTVSQEMQLGTELECDIVLPPELCQGKAVRVHCRGKIVRVERPDAEGRIGVAATIDDYEFAKVQG